jgi:hypothetical protein
MGAAAIVIIGVTVMAFWLTYEYRRVRTAVSEVRQDVTNVKSLSEELLEEVTRSSGLELAIGDRYELMVAGHIRALNGYDDAADPMYVNNLATLASRLQPEYMVFAGDTVLNGDAPHLAYIDNQLSQKFAVETGFVIGNHDLASSDYFDDELFSRLYRAPNWHVDVGDLRMVVLNTIGPGNTGLNSESIAYAHEVLDGSYKSAVIIMHHAIWLPGELGTFGNNSPEQLGVDPSEWSDELLPLLSPDDVVISGDGGKTSTFVTTLCGVRHYLTGWPSGPNDLDVLALDLGDNGLVVHLMVLDESLTQASAAIPARYPDTQPVCR